MKELFRSVGVAVVMFFGLAVGQLHAADGKSIDGIYDFEGGATVVFMATACGDEQVLRNIAGYDHNPAEFFNATIVFPDEPNNTVNACYEVSLAGDEVDIHWNADAYAVVPLEAGKRRISS